MPGLLFSGPLLLGGGAGVPFGDGLRCVGGPIVRHGLRLADANGDALWGPGLAAAGREGRSPALRGLRLWRPGLAWETRADAAGAASSVPRPRARPRARRSAAAPPCPPAGAG